MKTLVARQPVFDRQEKIFAYDLAVRGPLGPEGLHSEMPPEQLVAEIFLEIGIDRVADGHRVLVTVDRDMLLRGSVPLLPADRAIVQLRTGPGADADVIAACRDLVARGYQFVLCGEDPSRFAPSLVELAHVVKVDVSSIDPGLLPSVADSLRGYQARLLATNVRHRTERDNCAELGFDLFSGFRFSAPETLVRRELGIEHVFTFRVLKLVRDPNTSDQEIEDVVRRDVALSYKLLRMVNSAATGGRDIWSIGHALRLLGREQVARWLSVLLVTDGGGEGVRAELMHLALLRARMCELIAELSGVKHARGPLFLIGMVSVLDQLLETPMAALCDTMELAPDLRAALLHRKDFFGAALRLVEAYEVGAWNDVESLASNLCIAPADLRPLYFDALGWAGSHRKMPEEAAVAARA
jgi:EAL and modified HD-GYP domain-containing signal transduction protein